MALIDVDRDHRELHRCPVFQVGEQLVHHVAVLATRHGAEDAVAFRDHREVGDRRTDRLVEAKTELGRLSHGSHAVCDEVVDQLEIGEHAGTRAALGVHVIRLVGHRRARDVHVDPRVVADELA